MTDKKKAILKYKLILSQPIDDSMDKNSSIKRLAEIIKQKVNISNIFFRFRTLLPSFFIRRLI